MIPVILSYHELPSTSRAGETFVPSHLHFAILIRFLKLLVHGCPWQPKLTGPGLTQPQRDERAKCHFMSCSSKHTDISRQTKHGLIYPQIIVCRWQSSYHIA
jgi:hypothetical protein